MQMQKLEALERDNPSIGGLSIPEHPVLWRGAGLEWACTRQWSLPKLAERLYGRKIRVRATDDELDLFFKRRAADSPYDQIMLVDEYIGSITKVSRSDIDRPPYAGSISVRHDPISSDWSQELMKDCPIADWFSTSLLDEYSIWIGAAGQKSTIHNDPYNNLNAQIIGRKRFMVFAPDQHEYLYPQFIHAHLWASRIDPDSPNLEQYPKWSRARGYIGELMPGDLLFIPKFWWHSFSAIEAGLNINKWIYSDDESRQFWHEQPSAKQFMDYRELWESVERRYSALGSIDRDQNREMYERLRCGIGRLLTEYEGAHKQPNRT